MKSFFVPDRDYNGLPVLIRYGSSRYSAGPSVAPGPRLSECHSCTVPASKSSLSLLRLLANKSVKVQPKHTSCDLGKEARIGHDA